MNGSSNDSAPKDLIREPPERGFAAVMARNIEAMKERRAVEAQTLTKGEKLARAITRFTGSMPFVYLHLAIVALWVGVNLGWLPVAPRFDPTFVILATVASVEAIFLSTFVLISQNRAAAAADRQAELELQINLLAEHEITRIVQLTTAIAKQLGIEAADDPELEELKEDVAPEAVLNELSREEKLRG